jgi:HD-GYP domain-containing protein (c-di-GMP phosphodiesterase class II)
LRLGREYGLNSEQMKALEFGSLLHDIGKIGVPDSILRGIEFLQGAARVVAQHHEQWNGTGYPLGLRGEEIDINARIFAVADAFDAITSDRVYRRGKSYEAAAQELDDWAGRQFDPKVVEAFHRVPKEDWEELHRQSLLPKEDRFDVRQLVQTMESPMEAAVR